MPRHHALIVHAILLFQLTAAAQMNLQFDGGIHVERGSRTLDLAWTGGLNSPQVGQLDLDLDGLKDLVFFDRVGNKVITLRNTGGTGTSRYQHTKAYDNVWPFPELHDWALFHDYDCDGLEDIFTYSLAGFSVYRNTSTGNTLSFELLIYRVECDYVFVDGSSQRTNLLISADDIPGIADIDGDGDLDVLTFAQLGNFVEYYKNLSMETYGTCDSLIFVRRNACWGGFAENVSTNTITLNVNCFQVPSPEVVGGNDRSGDDDRAAHAGSTVTPIDLNGDGVQDLLLGDIAYSNLVALTNGGTVTSSLMTSVDESFPSTDIPVNLPVFPAAFHLDVDGDDRKDLLVCPSARGLGQNHKGVWYYRNTGTGAVPSFEFQQDDLFQSRMLDFGEGANPVPFDHNNDGLVDLVISNEGYYHPTGNYVGKMALLENIGTASIPAFRLITDDYMELSTSGIGMSMYPAFADLDGDGDKDMYIGDLQGKLHFYRNTATGPVAQFTLAQPNVTYPDGTVIDLGRQVTPQFVDLDRDGLMDLVVGEQNGNLNYLRNTGTTASPAWTLVTDSLGQVSTSTIYTLGHSVPFIFENADGAYELLAGSEAGTLWHYTNIDGNLDGAWDLRDDSFMGLNEGFRSTVCLTDLTGDGESDMVVGNFRGGVSFWRSDGTTSIGQAQAPISALRVLPNPSQGLFEVTAPPFVEPGKAWLSVRNSLGQEVERIRVSSTNTSLDLGHRGRGIYIIQLETEGVRHPPVRAVIH